MATRDGMIELHRRLGPALGQLRGAALQPPALPLRALPIAAGHERISAAYDWSGAQRPGPCVLFQYTIAGAGRLRVGRLEQAVLPGRLMLLPMPHDHRYWLPPGGRWEHAWAIVRGDEAMRVTAAAIARSGHLIALDQQGPSVTALVDLVRAVVTGDLGDPFRASAAVYGLLMALLEETVGTRDAVPDAAIARAIAHAREHACQDPGVPALARVAGLSRWHFSRRFHAATGRTPGRFVLDERLRRAVACLAAGGTAQAATAAAGFADPSYFGRVFRRAYGCTPGMFTARSSPRLSSG